MEELSNNKCDSLCTEESKPPMEVNPTVRYTSDANFCFLPPEVLITIFKHLKYSDVSNLHPLNRRLRDISSDYLNSAYSDMVKVISEYPLTEPNCNFSKYNACPELYTLVVLQTDIKALHAICGKYIEEEAICFHVGAILDLSQDIMRLCNARQTSRKDFGSKLATFLQLEVNCTLECLQSKKATLSKKLFTFITDVYAGNLYMAGGSNHTDGQVDVYIYINNAYFRWYIGFGDQKSPSAHQEAEAILKCVVPFVFADNRTIRFGFNAPHDERTKHRKIHVGDKHFNFTYKGSSCYCHRLLVGVRLQYPHQSEGFTPRAEGESELDYLHRLCESLPRQRKLEFYIKNSLCSPNVHSCVFDCPSWGLSSNEYSICIEDNFINSGNSQ